MPNPAKRFTANPARPVGRYRPGKPVAEQESSDEEESEEEQQSQNPPQRRPQPSRPHPAKPPVQRRDESEDEDEEGFVTDDEDGADATTSKVSAPQDKAAAIGPRTDRTSQADIKQESEDEEDESEDESLEEEEESSEEDVPQRKFQRPTFIKKSDRNLSSTPQASNATPETVANGTPAPEPEMDTQARRLAQAELLIKDKLERDAIARAQGKKAWDDDDEIIPESMVDDTDGLDPEGEFQAWKLRELKRLKRDREALIAREKEIEEIERRRNLTAEEREKEDQAYLEKQKADREENRHEASYLARYHHKGAFFQGDETAEVLKKRDVMGARFEDQVSDKSALPEYMRIRDMTKLGKKGRTRYTDMKNEDTGRFGEDVKRWRGSGGGPGTGGRGDSDMRGVDERFLPDDRRSGETPGPTGANASAVAPRRERVEDSDRNRERGRDGHRDTYRPGDTSRDRRDETRERDRDRDRRKRSYSRSRSRSRSPRRRKRDHSYERDSRERGDYRHRDSVRA
jgi:microfibrillar-associated protein 1